MNRVFAMIASLTGIAVIAVGSWVAGSKIESPADAAARTAPPIPSPILVPVELRTLGSSIVTRGTARFGLPQPISIAPSTLKASTSLITTLPLRNAQIMEGSVILTASGRPVFALEGQIPAFRDLTPGTKGDDVLQLEKGLRRLGFDPGPIDGLYDHLTGAAVSKWYRAKGWEAFGPTREQLAVVRILEKEWIDAAKIQILAVAATQAAVPAVDAARATAEHNVRMASVELANKVAERRRLEQSLQNDTNRSVEEERAKATYADAAAAAELAAQIAERAFIELDPRQPDTARINANARLEVARAAVQRTTLAGQVAIQVAERAAMSVGDRLKQAEVSEISARTAEKSVRLEGDRLVRAALDAQKLADLDAKQATDRERQLAADLEIAKRKMGVQIPVDELVFIRKFPVRVEEIKSQVGGSATATVMTVTDNQLSIDSSLSLESAPLVRPGMPVIIDEQALGGQAQGIVASIASTPGTRGVDHFHIYMEVKVEPTTVKLDGFSVRLTIPVKSTQGAVTVVPVSAVSLAADSTTRIQVKRNDQLEYIQVTPGLSADGFVEITSVNGKLERGELVVVGYNNLKASVGESAKSGDESKTRVSTTVAAEKEAKAPELK